jgi:hypothetical protein
MGKTAIRNFPQEIQRGPWPLLQVSPEDRHYIPTPESRLARRWRLMYASLDLLFLDLGIATLKGALFGLLSFAIVFSFITLRAQGFWLLVDWHWVFAVGGIALLLLLLGFDLALVAIAAVALWLSFGAMLVHPTTLLLFIGSGVLVGWIIELFPLQLKTS